MLLNGDTETARRLFRNINRANPGRSIDWCLEKAIHDEEGIECEFLKASTGGGWQKGKIRVREFSLHLEFVPDVPDEPEPSPDTTALAPLSELLNPDQQ
jgi:hypothetical protein